MSNAFLTPDESALMLKYIERVEELEAKFKLAFEALEDISKTIEGMFDVSKARTALAAITQSGEKE